jgi:phosphoglycolate phosphatase-like HAD superfamily hydrolase
MATGRPFAAAEYSLRYLMSYFDRRASTYIGDSDVYPELASEYEKYRKPRGERLIRAREEFGTDGMLYVGDSVEDQMMVEDAKRKHDGILFAAVSGTALNRDEQVRCFTERGADVVMRSVEQVPLVLEAFRS